MGETFILFSRAWSAQERNKMIFPKKSKTPTAKFQPEELHRDYTATKIHPNKKGAFRLPKSLTLKMVGRDGFEPT